MKYLITGLIIVTALTGCNKSDEVQKTSQVKLDSVTTAAALPLEQTLSQADMEKMRTADGAFNIITNYSQGGPIPPHYLPAKDSKLESKTDSTATYTFTSGTTGKKVKLVMRKFGHGADIIWNLGSVSPMD